MNESEAQSILELEMAGYRRRPYSELLSLVGQAETCERASPSGVTYQIEVQVFFDDGSSGNLRVAGAVDDGGRRAFRPLCDDFIMSPDGAFVGD